MGKFSTGDKPKFDWITASKTKKYKIITAVVLAFGVLLLAGGLLLKNFVTSAVTPNALKIENLSNLQGKGPLGYHCVISTNQTFMLNTGTVSGRPLANPITFTLLDGAENFLEVWDSTDSYAINSSHYSGLFNLHIKADAPAYVTNTLGVTERPTGTLQINCGSYILQIEFTYHQC